MKLIKFFTIIVCCFLLVGCGKEEVKNNEVEVNTEVESETESEIIYDDFQMVIEDVFTITGRGTVVTGKVSLGEVKTGDIIQIKKQDGTYMETEVAGIEMFRKMLDVAVEGDNVGILLKDIERTEVARGDILVK